MSLYNERERAKEVNRVVRSVHAEGMGLLEALVEESNNLCAILSTSPRIRDDSLLFRTLLLSQTINAAINVVRLIDSGYPRVALSLARLLREGHIGVWWAIFEPEKASASWARIDTHDSSAPLMPPSGEMAKLVEERFKAEGTPKGMAWGPFILSAGNTHSKLFSHALSEVMLNLAYQREGSEIVPKVGPTYDANLTGLAIDHMMPFFAFLLADSANLVGAVTIRSRPPDVQGLLDKAEQWWAEHQIPLIELPAWAD